MSNSILFISHIYSIFPFISRFKSNDIFFKFNHYFTITHQRSFYSHFSVLLSKRLLSFHLMTELRSMQGVNKKFEFDWKQARWKWKRIFRNESLRGICPYFYIHANAILVSSTKNSSSIQPLLYTLQSGSYNINKGDGSVYLRVRFSVWRKFIPSSSMFLDDIWVIWQNKRAFY